MVTTLLTTVAATLLFVTSGTATLAAQTILDPAPESVAMVPTWDLLPGTAEAGRRQVDELLRQRAHELDAFLDQQRDQPLVALRLLAVEAGGLGASLGLRIGDRLIADNGRPLTMPQDFVTTRAERARPITLLSTDGGRRTITCPPGRLGIRFATELAPFGDLPLAEAADPAIRRLAQAWQLCERKEPGALASLIAAYEHGLARDHRRTVLITQRVLLAADRAWSALGWARLAAEMEADLPLGPSLYARNLLACGFLQAAHTRYRQRQQRFGPSSWLNYWNKLLPYLAELQGDTPFDPITGPRRWTPCTIRCRPTSLRAVHSCCHLGDMRTGYSYRNAGDLHDLGPNGTTFLCPDNSYRPYVFESVEDGPSRLRLRLSAPTDRRHQAKETGAVAIALLEQPPQRTPIIEALADHHGQQPFDRESYEHPTWIGAQVMVFETGISVRMPPLVGNLQPISGRWGLDRSMPSVEVVVEVNPTCWRLLVDGEPACQLPRLDPGGTFRWSLIIYGEAVEIDRFEVATAGRQPEAIPAWHDEIRSAVAGHCLALESLMARSSSIASTEERQVVNALRQDLPEPVKEPNSIIDNLIVQAADGDAPGAVGALRHYLRTSDLGPAGKAHWPLLAALEQGDLPSVAPALRQQEHRLSKDKNRRGWRIDGRQRKKAWYGAVHTRDSDGRLRQEAWYWNDTRHGRQRSFDAAGALQEESWVFDDLPRGPLRRFHPDGQIAEAAFRYDLHRHEACYIGARRTFYPDGRPHSKRFYAAGLLHGAVTCWHANGQVALEGHYEWGEAIGRWRLIDPTGVVSQEQEGRAFAFTTIAGFAPDPLAPPPDTHDDDAPTTPLDRAEPDNFDDSEPAFGHGNLGAEGF